MITHLVKSANHSKLLKQLNGLLKSAYQGPQADPVMYQNNQQPSSTLGNSADAVLTGYQGISGAKSLYGGYQGYKAGTGFANGVAAASGARIGGKLPVVGSLLAGADTYMTGADAYGRAQAYGGLSGYAQAAPSSFNKDLRKSFWAAAPLVGAGIGSAVPGVGTAIGAAVGTGVGAVGASSEWLQEKSVGLDPAKESYAEQLRTGKGFGNHVAHAQALIGQGQNQNQLTAKGWFSDTNYGGNVQQNNLNDIGKTK